MKKILFLLAALVMSVSSMWAQTYESGVYEIKNVSSEGGNAGRGYLIDYTSWTEGPSIGECAWTTYKSLHPTARNNGSTTCSYWYLYNDEGTYYLFSLSTLNGNTAPKFLKMGVQGADAVKRCKWQNTKNAIEIKTNTSRSGAVSIRNAGVTATDEYLSMGCGAQSTSGCIKVDQFSDGGTQLSFIAVDESNLTTEQVALKEAGIALCATTKEYTVTLVNAPADATITVAGQEYANGETVQSKKALTEADVTAVYQDYTTEVVVGESTITVTYTYVDPTAPVATYIIKSPRGTLFAGEEVLLSTCESSKAGQMTTDNSRWVVVEGEANHQIYLYNLGTKKFLNGNNLASGATESAATNAPMTDQPWAFYRWQHGMTDTNQSTGIGGQPNFNYPDYPWVIGEIDGKGTDNQYHTINVTTWMANGNGYRLCNTSGIDAGNAYAFTETETITAEEYQAIRKLVYPDPTFDYVVTLTDAPADATITVAGEQYSNGQTVTSETELTEADVTAEYEGYTTEVTVAEGTITVVYTEVVEPVDMLNVSLQTKEGKYFLIDTDVNMGDAEYAWNIKTLGDNAFRLQSNVNTSLYVNSGSHGYLSKADNVNNSRRFFFYEVTSQTEEALDAKLVAMPVAGKEYVIGVSNITSGYHGFYAVIGRRCSSAATSSQRLDALQINNTGAVNSETVEIPATLHLLATAATTTGTINFQQTVWTIIAGEPAPEPFAPEAGKFYSLKEKTSGLYVNITESADHKKDVIWGTEAEAFSFTNTVDGYTIQNLQGKYIGKYTNTWNMDNRTAEYWTIEAGENIENEIKLRCAQGHLGADNLTAGQALYRDKAGHTFIVEEMTLPTTEVTYTVKFNGETLKTETVTEYVGQAPTFQVGAPTYVTVEGMPTEITAETSEVEVTTTLNEQAPFDMENAFYLNFQNGTKIYWFNDNNSGKLNELRNVDGVEESTLDDASRWTFGGDWLNGFTLQNVKTGNYVAAGDDYNNGTNLKMGETAEKYELVKFTSGWRLKVNNTFLAHTSHDSHIVSYWSAEDYVASYVTFTKYVAPEPIEPVETKTVTITFVTPSGDKYLLNNIEGTQGTIAYTEDVPASAVFEATLWTNGKYTYTNANQYVGYNRMDSEFTEYNFWEVLPLEGEESTVITEIVPEGSVYLKVDHRSATEANAGVMIVYNADGNFTKTTAPFFNGTYTSAILIEEYVAPAPENPFTVEYDGNETFTITPQDPEATYFLAIANDAIMGIQGYTDPKTFFDEYILPCCMDLDECKGEYSMTDTEYSSIWQYGLTEGLNYILVANGHYDWNEAVAVRTGDIYVFEITTGVPTGVGTVLRNEVASKLTFNLQGQRISKIQKGINIVNGKKVLK